MTSDFLNRAIDIVLHVFFGIFYVRKYQVTNTILKQLTIQETFVIKK